MSTPQRRLVLVWVLRLAPLLLAGAIPVAGACSKADATGTSCCKICTSGKACGDSCIAAGSTCHAGAGCACNGSAPQ
jgi:hypothetical protein